MALLENLGDYMNNWMVSAVNYRDPRLSLKWCLLILGFPSYHDLPLLFHCLHLFCGVPVARGEVENNAKYEWWPTCLNILGLFGKINRSEFYPVWAVEKNVATVFPFWASEALAAVWLQYLKKGMWKLTLLRAIFPIRSLYVWGPPAKQLVKLSTFLCLY